MMKLTWLDIEVISTGSGWLEIFSRTDMEMGSASSISKRMRYAWSGCRVTCSARNKLHVPRSCITIISTVALGCSGLLGTNRQLHKTGRYEL